MQNLINLKKEKLEALFDPHVNLIFIKPNTIPFVKNIILQIEKNGLGLHTGVKITALMDVKGCPIVATLIPSNYFNSLDSMSECIQHELKNLQKNSRQLIHSYLLNKNQLNLFKHV